MRDRIQLPCHDRLEATSHPESSGNGCRGGLKRSLRDELAVEPGFGSCYTTPMGSVFSTCRCCGHASSRTRSPHTLPHRLVYRITDGADALVARCFQRCERCRSLYLPDEVFNALEVDYATQDTQRFLAQEEARKKSALKLARFIHARVPFPRRRLLEVGCAGGYFLEASRSLGAIVSGIEPSKDLTSFASSLLGMDIVNCHLHEATLPNESYGMVVMLDVLEHLDDPVSAIKQAFQWLEPNGWLVLLTPIADSMASRFLGARWWSRLPSHPVIFSRQRLFEALQDAQFSVKWHRWQPRFLPLGQVVMHLKNVVGLRYGGARDHGLHANLRVNAFDQMLLLAQK